MFLKNRLSLITLSIVMLAGISVSIFVDIKGYSKESPYLSSGEKNTNLSEKVDTFLNPFIPSYTPGAAIAIIENGDIVYTNGYGMSDINNMEPVFPEKTIFNYGSVGKMFIWVSAMQLVEQNKLDLNKDIREYLPNGYPVKCKSNSKITMLNLMNHDAGFDAATSSLGELADSNAGSIGKAVADFYDVEQCFDEGTIRSYSNYGTNLAAYIIECITNMDFYKYVEENIFKPCSMNVFYPEKNPVEELMIYKAKGYKYISEGKFEEENVYRSNWLYPSGSAVGTVKDLALFAKALMPKEGEKSPLFNSNSTLEEMFSRSYETIEGEEIFSMHHGFWGSSGSYVGIGHSGQVDGFTSQFVINPETHFAIISLANEGEAYAVTRGLAREITGSNYETPVENVSELPSSKDVVGEYFNSRGRFHGEGEPPTVFKITSNEENIIKIDNGERTILFKQIRPYLYMDISCNQLQEEYKSKIYFTVKNGNVIKATLIHSELIPCY